MANPKRIKIRNGKTERQKKKLASEVRLTNAEVKRAMVEASKALDTLASENAALRRIIVAERSQLIYYTEKAQQFLRHEAVEFGLVNFADLPEDQQEKHVKQAIIELGSDQGIIPHNENQLVTEGEPPKKGLRLIH